MRLVFSRRRRLGRGVNLNLSRSGASASKSFGPLTINSRGRVSLRLGHGIRITL